MGIDMKQDPRVPFFVAFAASLLAQAAARPGWLASIFNTIRKGATA